MATEDITFLDLAVLLKISPGMVLEKIGGMINSSIFDASNIAGGLKQKGLIDFAATFPGPTTLQITDDGKALIADANAKGSEPFDKLDESILLQLSGGKRMPAEMQGALNIRSKDLALRIYKLSMQGFATYELKNGNAYIMLTEQGFLRAKTETKMVAPMEQQAGAMPGQPMQDMTAQQQAAQQAAANQKVDPAKMPRKPPDFRIIIVLVVILVIGLAAIWYQGLFRYI